MDEPVKAQFQDLRNTESVLILDTNPDVIKDSKGVAGPVTNLPGKYNPRVSAGAGGIRTIILTLRVARLREDMPVSFVKDTVSWFYSVLSPYVDSKFENHNWTPVQFKWGDFYDLPVRIRKVDCTFPLFRFADALPEYSDVSLTLEEVSVENISTPEIRTEAQGFVRFLT